MEMRKTKSAVYYIAREGDRVVFEHPGGPIEVCQKEREIEILSSEQDRLHLRDAPRAPCDPTITLALLIEALLEGLAAGTARYKMIACEEAALRCIDLADHLDNNCTLPDVDKALEMGCEGFDLDEAIRQAAN